MKLKDIAKEELESMGYDDIAYMILTESGKKMKINDIFKKECKLLGLSDQEFEDKIADFFELLSTDKRFIMLENGYWDLRDKHSHKIVIDDNDDDDAVIEADDDDTLEEDGEEFYDETDDDDDATDDLEDLVVINVDDEETDSL